VKTVRILDFVALFAGPLIVVWHPLASTLGLALKNDAYTHILLILPLSFTFICVEWKSLQADIKLSLPVGFLILCAAGMVAILSRWQTPPIAPDVRLSINMVALVLWWIGAFTFCFGAQVSRRLLFPLGFLFWMVPFPLFLLNWIVSLLQQWSAFSARCLFVITGVPVAQDGLSLSIPGLTLEVAQECSSIRSSLMLLVTTMVLAQLVLRSPWRKALVIALVVPLSVAKNGLRIFTIAMLGTRADPGFLTGRLHHQGGIVFFSIALIAVFVLLWILRRKEDRLPPSPVMHPAGP